MFYFQISGLRFLNFCLPAAFGRASHRCFLCSVWFARFRPARAGKDTAWIRVSLGAPLPLHLLNSLRSIAVTFSGVSRMELGKWMIPFCLSLCILSSGGKPVVIHLPSGMIFPPTLARLSWFAELTEASRPAIFWSVVPSCFTLDEVIAYFLTDTWKPIYDLFSHNSSSERAGALLTGWYLPYILQITNSGSHPPMGPPGAQVITCCFSLRAF